MNGFIGQSGLPSVSPFRLAEIAIPIAAAGQVLVRIHASGVNPLDTKIFAGRHGAVCQSFGVLLRALSR